MITFHLHVCYLLVRRNIIIDPSAFINLLSIADVQFVIYISNKIINLFVFSMSSIQPVDYLYRLHWYVFLSTCSISNHSCISVSGTSAFCFKVTWSFLNDYKEDVSNSWRDLAYSPYFAFNLCILLFNNNFRAVSSENKCHLRTCGMGLRVIKSTKYYLASTAFLLATELYFKNYLVWFSVQIHARCDWHKR